MEEKKIFYRNRDSNFSETASAIEMTYMYTSGQGKKGQSHWKALERFCVNLVLQLLSNQKITSKTWRIMKTPWN